jgi:hypothetical protein
MTFLSTANVPAPESSELPNGYHNVLDDGYVLCSGWGNLFLTEEFRLVSAATVGVTIYSNDREAP